MIGDRTEREDIEVFAVTIRVNQRFGRHIGGANVIDQAVDMRSRRHFSGYTLAGSPSSVAHLPVVNFHLWPAAIGIGDQYALRAQCPVNYFLVVGETNDLSDLSDQIEADIDTKPVFGLSKKMVESNGL